ncbi:MAG: hypothetical protein O8C55_11195 [Candidatus Methanoperedens sp.]|nr:hypothetical protein [Candidatus Methanoperedens sp.]
MDNRSMAINGRAINNPLHKKIAAFIQFPDCKILKSVECGGTQNIPLFCSTEKGNDTEYCNVDLMILKNERIKVIIEIEESGITPSKICGKFLTSALSSNYIHESESNQPIDMDESVTFIQILDISELKESTSKKEQLSNIEKSIQKIIPVKDSKIDEYKLFFGNNSDFDKNRLNEVADFIQEVLK